ncbi:hypothetical protein RFI_26148 [Reticulomyxa filosa]|uniref:Uncharacterized protein n=1 Tax=Reticulomyxa filosa TaxID=46433 RepID=X6MB36_RETFI|nr:hypothetical protein RFI_26148 [Reticulomyxa filosa]|eukprot:ETO11228.1 hypothetical protein RFI_26148 [Reticulomyxa filosa]
MANQLQQLQEKFATVEKETISKVWKICKENFDKAAKMLDLAKSTTSEGRKYFMELSKQYSYEIEKAKFLEASKNSNQIFDDTFTELNNAYSARDLNRLKVDEHTLHTKIEKQDKDKLKMTREKLIEICATSNLNELSVNKI